MITIGMASQALLRLKFHLLTMPIHELWHLQAGDVDMAVSIGPGEYGIFQNDKKFTIYEESSLRDVFVR